MGSQKIFQTKQRIEKGKRKKQEIGIKMSGPELLVGSCT